MKDLRLLTLLLFLPQVGAAQAPEKFVSIFDGKTLNGWVYVGKGENQYFVENGVLVYPAAEDGNLFTEKSYSNFVLQFEFRTEEGGNNGVGIRAPLDNNVHYSGIEIQILDDQAPRYQGILKPAQYHGSVYDVVPARPGFLKKVGEWNQQEIIASGRHIQVVLNGTTITNADLDSVRDPEVLQRHPGLRRSSGHIGLLGHRSRVEFRNIRIRELP